MAIVITSENLNSFGDQGTFEADQSTWGFGSNTKLTASHARRSEAAYEGNFGLRGVLTYNSAFSAHLVSGQVAIPSGGGKVFCSLYIKNDAAQPALKPNFVLRNGAFTALNVIGDTSDISNWTKLEFFFEWTNAGTKILDIRVDANDYQDGIYYVDQFEIFFYEEESSPCTLEFDFPNTAIGPSSPGASNGQIILHVIGGNGTIEYSIDQVNYQISNTFTGLPEGFYTVIAREVDNPACFVQSTVHLQAGVGDPLFNFIVAEFDETTAGRKDGRLEITIDPAVGGPFTTSIDGGTTWTSQTIYAGLAPGTYTVSVRDDSLQIRVKSATIQPGRFDFDSIYLSKDPIIFNRAASANKSNPNYRINAEVKKETAPGSGLFETITNIEHEPGVDDTTHFNFRSTVRGLLDPQPPQKGQSTFRKVEDRTALMQVTFGDLYDQLTSPVDTEDSSPFLVVYGGLEKRRFPNLSLFKDRGTTPAHLQPLNTKFLTWAPRERIMDKGQEDYVCFYSTPGYTKLQLLADIHYTDGTSITSHQLLDFISAPKGTITEVPIGPSNCGVLTVDPAKIIGFYTLRVTDQLTYGSEQLTIKVSQKKPKHVKYYLFLNSLGTFEVMRCTGKSIVTSRISKKTYQKYLPPDYQALDGEIGSFGSSNERKSKVSSGYLVTKETLAWFQDFALSEEVYDITTGERIPVIIEAEPIKLNEDNDFRHFARFTARETYSNEVFTPEVLP